MPGRGHSDKWWREYEALRKKGHTKESAARITNSTQKRSTKKKKG
jgi:hypothetical protein